MAIFLAGILLFFATHLFTAFARGGREALVQTMGANGYKGLYSLVALAGLALVVLGWPEANAGVVYAPPPWMRHVTYLFNLFAFILLAAAYLPAGKIAAAAKHPMVAGVKVWAFAHLLSNGEVRSLILFGAFLAYGVVDRIALKRRDAPTRPAGPARDDLIAVGVGAAAYSLVLFYLHPVIAGVALVAPR